MYLKRISIHGFKSFPDAVDFDFSPGVTCIVGPNGCGKSNVIDAFKWVLGEQSAKLLRGRQMSDMIFNGSASRKSSGMARVDLYFDNSDHQLPVDYDQVCISRKLYRSGESEYLINNEDSRLKDVRDLFMDSGVGADTYSVIEQGRVENLLTSSSTERRAIFEEAAGIGKYKARKRDAQRKLERTQQNLLRVSDIIEEVQKRLRSVKLQAGKARSFQVHESRLKELRASYSLSEFHRLTQSIAELTVETTKATDSSTALRTQIDRNETETARLAETLDQLAEELSRSEQNLMQTRSDLAANQERIDAAQRRIAELNTALERVGARITQLETQREDYETRLAEIQAEAVTLQTETNENAGRIDRLTDDEQRQERELTELNALIEDEKAGLVDLVRRSTQLRNEITSLKSHQENLKAEHTRLDQRDAVVRAELEGLLSRKSALESRRSELAELIEAETARLQEKSEEADRIEARRTELTEQLAAAREKRSAVGSRLQVLAELERKMEGVGEGVRSILDQLTARPDDPALSGVCGMVGDLFEADVRYAQVVEAAIGERDQALVMESSRTFLANSAAYDGLPGRLTALFMDRLPPVINEEDPTDHPGFVANAADLVHCDEKYRRLARHLLGKTVVVSSLEHALALAAEDIGGRRFVTLSGELVEPDGSISFGPPSSRAGLIARKSERRDLGVQLEKIEEHSRSLRRELNRIEAEAAHVSDVRRDLQTAVHEANNAKVEAGAALEAVSEAVERLAKEQPVIAGEVAIIAQQLTETKERESRSEASAGQLDIENKDGEEAVSKYNQRVESLTVDRDRVRHELTESRIAAAKLASKRASIADSINHLRHGMRTTEEALSVTVSEKSDSQLRLAESADAIAVARERLDQLSATAERLEAATLQARRRREMTRLESEKIAIETKTLRSDLEGIEAQLHQAQLAQQESIVRRDELAARVKDELGIEIAELYQSYDHTDQDWTEVESEIADLRQKIARLGNVNLGAIQEQAELEERDQFLTGQFQDLDDSRRQLEDLIRKLDGECVERFTKILEVIRAHFRDLFRKLFGGGKADIILEDPDDPLESGIEILAKPPGKELQRISLMSGGEKTMTAIALLMSIFRSRPSPLALLDEVDAALDEANNVRFNQIIREFLDRSQFILVTHSKRTMSIADQLYGVTMQEPGVSARVSVKFEGDSNSSQTAVA